MNTGISHNYTKTITYSWKLEIPSKIGQCMKYEEFPFKMDNDDGEIVIHIESEADPKPKLRGETNQMKYRVTVIMQKMEETSTKGEMKLHIMHKKEGTLVAECVSFNDWQDVCFFRNSFFTCSSIDPIFDIVLKITWTIPESPNLYPQISEFLLSEFLSDVTIVIGDDKILAHKMVLCAASPVMRAMLTSPMKEAKENCIVIKDVETDVMKAVLKLLYTGKDEQFHEVGKLLKALAVAEKYDIKKLKRLCEQKMLKELEIGNAVMVLDVADTYRAKTLVEDCLKFIVDHKKEIIHTEDCQELYLRKPQLMMQFRMRAIDDTKI